MLHAGRQRVLATSQWVVARPAACRGFDGRAGPLSDNIEKGKRKCTLWPYMLGICNIEDRVCGGGPICFYEGVFEKYIKYTKPKALKPKPKALNPNPYIP